MLNDFYKDVFIFEVKVIAVGTLSKERDTGKRRERGRPTRQYSDGRVEGTR